VTQTLTSSPTQKFSLRTPLLSKGRSMELLAKANMMYAHVKVYAEGGENVIHAHQAEDHLFVVLEGQATFHLDADDKVTVVDKHEGVMIPRGAYYYFQSSGDTNLVLLRVGARPEPGPDDRVAIDGGPLPGHSAANKHEEGVVIPGKFFT
jgi:mannose-6-phosphate isomerase-like protein (cupin superfamily)